MFDPICILYFLYIVNGLDVKSRLTVKEVIQSREEALITQTITESVYPRL